MNADNGFVVLVSCYNAEANRIERVAKALARAFGLAAERGIDDQMASTLISVRDHKGTLFAEWTNEVWEIDNEVEPDLPSVFVLLEAAWGEQGEYHVTHKVGDREVERYHTP